MAQCALSLARNFHQRTHTLSFQSETLLLFLYLPFLCHHFHFLFMAILGSTEKLFKYASILHCYCLHFFQQKAYGTAKHWSYGCSPCHARMTTTKQKEDDDHDFGAYGATKLQQNFFFASFYLFCCIMCYYGEHYAKME